MGVGDPRDAGLVDDLRTEPGDLLGHEDALLEPAVGQLEPGDDVADREHVRRPWCAVDHWSPRSPCRASLRSPRTPWTRCWVRAPPRPAGRRRRVVAGVEGDGHRVLVLRHLRHPHTCLRGDLATTECPLEVLGDRSSSFGTSRGIASTIVTDAPNDAQTLANSTPMTPPPRMIAFFGTDGNTSAWSLVTTRPPMLDGRAASSATTPLPGRRTPPVISSSVDLHSVGSDQPSAAVDDGDAVRVDEALQSLVQAGDDGVLVAQAPSRGRHRRT